MSTNGDFGNQPSGTQQGNDQHPTEDADSRRAQEMEALKSFFNSWPFPDGSEPLKQAILKLMLDYETCVTEKKTAVAVFPGPAPVSQGTINPLYETDEEELQQETNWTLQESRKNKKKKPGGNTQGTSRKNPEERRPPPIYVDKPGKISNLTNIVNTEIGPENYTTRIVDNNKVKINLEDGDSYRKTVQVLQRENLMFHTYENKQTRPIRVMAKGLDNTTEPDEIVDYLVRKGFKIAKADPKLSAREKKPLNMFILSFDNSENIDSIYKIREILRQIVQICPMKGNKMIPQCKNCQEFGHTKNHCNKKARCVKCAQGHLTAQCNKPAEARAKCANCSGDHPASYRGCMIAKELQKRNKSQARTNRVNNTKTNSSSKNNRPIQSQPPQVGQLKASFADAVRSQASQNDIQQQILSGIRDLKRDMLSLTERVERIETRSKPGPKPKKS